MTEAFETCTDSTYASRTRFVQRTCRSSNPNCRSSSTDANADKVNVFSAAVHNQSMRAFGSRYQEPEFRHVSSLHDVSHQEMMNVALRAQPSLANSLRVLLLRTHTGSHWRPVVQEFCLLPLLLLPPLLLLLLLHLLSLRSFTHLPFLQLLLSLPTIHQPPFPHRHSLACTILCTRSASS